MDHLVRYTFIVVRGDIDFSSRSVEYYMNIFLLRTTSITLTAIWSNSITY